MSHAECRILSAVFLSVVTLSVVLQSDIMMSLIMLGVVMLSVVVLRVEAPSGFCNSANAANGFIEFKIYLIHYQI